MDEAGENEVSIHWLSSDSISKRGKSDSVDCIYAFNTKAISGVPMPGISSGKKTVLRETLSEVHEQLQSLLEMAESDPTLLPGMVWYGVVWCGMVWCDMVIL